MAKYAKQLAIALDSVAVGNGADADVDGWVDLPANARSPVVSLAGENGANLTALIETIDINGDIGAYHTEVFSENGVKYVALLDFPYSKVRLRNSVRAAGDLSGAIHYTA